MTPEQEHQLLSDVREIKLVLKGDGSMGVEGLVHQVKAIQKWRSRLDARILTISGFVAGAFAVLKYLVNK